MTLHSITCWHIKSTQLHKLKPFFVVLLNITYNGSLLSVNRAILRHFLRRKNSEIINIITSMMYSTQCLLNLISFLEGRHLFALIFVPSYILPKSTIHEPSNARLAKFEVLLNNVYFIHYNKHINEYFRSVNTAVYIRNEIFFNFKWQNRNLKCTGAAKKCTETASCFAKTFK